MSEVKSGITVQKEVPNPLQDNENFHILDNFEFRAVR